MYFCLYVNYFVLDIFSIVSELIGSPSKVLAAISIDQYSKGHNAYLANQSRQAWIVEDQFYSQQNNRDHKLSFSEEERDNKGERDKK